MGLVGGHCMMTNIDWGVLAYLTSTFPIKTMVDVGCGPGGMVEVARKFGISAVGIDGDETVKPDILHNFDDGVLMIEPFDLAWSVEFLEHIEEKYLVNVFSVFNKAKYVFCTHNQKPGPWHFNCKENEYWIEVFRINGFHYCEDTTMMIKMHSTMEREFVHDTGTFFIKG